MRARAWAAVLGLALLTPVASAQAAQRAVDIPGKFFEPSRLAVLAGDTVTWTNDDAITHTVTAEDDSFDTPLEPGQTTSVTFDRPGSYPYLCTIHRSIMHGVIDVYALALSGPPRTVPAGGRVELRGLAPPGTEAVTIESRPAKGPYRPLATIAPGGAGRFRYTAAPGASTRYRAVAGTLVSPTVAVAVSPRITLAVTRSRGGVVVHAAVAPAQRGARVVLETYVRELFDWRPRRNARLDRGSRAVFRLAPGRAVRVRVVILRPGRGYAPGASESVLIRPPPGRQKRY